MWQLNMVWKSKHNMYLDNKVNMYMQLGNSCEHERKKELANFLIK